MGSCTRARRTSTSWPSCSASDARAGLDARAQAPGVSLRSARGRRACYAPAAHRRECDLELDGGRGGTVAADQADAPGLRKLRLIVTVYIVRYPFYHASAPTTSSSSMAFIRADERSRTTALARDAARAASTGVLLSARATARSSVSVTGTPAARSRSTCRPTAPDGSAAASSAGKTNCGRTRTSSSEPCGRSTHRPPVLAHRTTVASQPLRSARLLSPWIRTRLPMACRTSSGRAAAGGASAGV